ncbi:MAG: hypothetical protein ABSH09_26220 [Bryobacteraceae bacterium]
MLIRNPQIQSLEAAALRNFENEMVEHLFQFARRHSEVVGAESVRNTARMGMERAAKYGFDNRGPVRFYIELIAMFGMDFDTDPQYPWAADALRNPAIPDQMERAERLYEAFNAYLDKAAGPENQFAIAALRRSAEVRWEDLAAPGSATGPAILRRFQALYPEKFAYVGPPALVQLVRSAEEAAGAHGLGSGAGSALAAGLMFTMGHGFISDPQFPWIASTLNNEAIAASNKKAERLFARMKTYLNAVLKGLEPG